MLLATLPTARVTGAAEPRPADFGTKWVRKHPFTLMALTQRPEALARLSRETGAAENVNVHSGTLGVTLRGGTGDLFKNGDGRFAGLEPAD